MVAEARTMAWQNEAEVGQAIKESGVAREDIWLTSKVGEILLQQTT